MRYSLGVLKVFISKGCRGCGRALELVAWARKLWPDLSIEVVDLSKNPDANTGRVFAVPAYVYEDRQVFLGNPSWGEFSTWIGTLGTGRRKTCGLL